MTQDDGASPRAELVDGPPAEPDPDAIALGTLEALQSEVNAAIDRMKAKYLVSALLVPLQMPPGGAGLYENPGFEEAVRLAVMLARHLRQHGLENVVVNGLGFVVPAVEVAHRDLARAEAAMMARAEAAMMAGTTRWGTTR